MIKFNQYIVPSKMPEEIISRKGHDSVRYLNTANAFDIETSSYHDADDNKRAIMYIWMMGIDDQIVYGRTWGEFQWFLHYLKEQYQLGEHKRMVIYVHNLGYEFQFLINHVELTKTFSRKKRHPIKTLMDDGFELRCSYFLSGLSLENTAKDLNIKKQIGLLDYRKLRHSKTPLTENELKYCEYDIKVVIAFINKEIQKCGDITKIPLTKTGYVREYCRNYIKKNFNYTKYRNMIKNEFPDESTFILLNKAFAGGFTHANFEYLFNEEKNVHSVDFTSSYPCQMIMHKYPRGKFIHIGKIEKEDFLRRIKTYACVFEIKINNIEAKNSNHIWSSDKCAYGTNKIYNAVVDNGRLVKSDCIYTYMTDVDFKIFKQFYKFDDDYEVYNFKYTTYDYLPKGIIECILKFYSDKTTLKGIAGQEDFYLVAKGMLNAIYGMMVTNPVNDEIIFDIEADDIWSFIRPPINEALNKVKNSPNTFLCYQWGVWVTAWARYELLKAVYNINDDVIYCDTDSIKFHNYKKHKKFLDKHNEEIKKGLLKTINYFRLDENLLHPKDKKGEEHYLGIWTDEGEYDVFKTIGAKRYMYVIGNRLHATISGMNSSYVYKEDVEKLDIKQIPKEHRDEFADIPIEKWMEHWELNYKYSPMNYIINHGGLKFFEDGMEIPENYSKRLVHTYSKEGDQFRDIVTDYLGNKCVVEEFCYIHLEPTTFSASIGSDFKMFILENIMGAELDGTRVHRTKRPELAITIMERELINRE